jgi:predicted transcriptional regulator
MRINTTRPKFKASVPAFRVDEKTRKQLDQIAIANNVSLSDVMRYAIGVFLIQNDTKSFNKKHEISK